jgi:hypothetical protein
MSPYLSTEPLRDSLLDLRAVVASLTPAQYVTLLPGFQSTIGAQVRHCHDHLRAFLKGAARGRIDYEVRARGSAIEVDREAALVALDVLRERLAEAPPAGMGGGVLVVDRIDPSGPPVEMNSTIGRELNFVTSHTTHHNALIGAMVGALGVAVPRWFGFAASTLAYLDRTSCAR